MRQKKSKVFGALCKALGVWEDCGETMISCHPFKNGCVGYARDSVTMIAFTASDDKKPETLNNRKTNRQLFMYKVGNGVLLQSRLYTTCRDNSYGGVECDECGWEYDEDDLTEAYNADGERVLVCDDCLLHNYFYCDECETYHHNNCLAIEEHGRYICYDCARENENYFYCEDCDSYHHIDEQCWVGDDYNGHYVCNDCFEEYSYCNDCECYHYSGNVLIAYDENGDEIQACRDCLENHYTLLETEYGDEYWHNDAIENGFCPHCHEEDDTEGGETKKSA